MKYTDASAQLAGYRQQIASIREQMRATQAAIEPQPVDDYEFSTVTGPVRMSALFGKHRDLIVVHNMGTGCSSCTMWADGYNGVHAHVTTRAAFVIASPDVPAVQQRFAQSRGWNFPMVSHAGTSFASDMGYRSKSGGWLPGLSIFRRTEAGIVRVADAGARPGDDFCVVWHLFDLLPEGSGDWQPLTQASVSTHACCQGS